MHLTTPVNIAKQALTLDYSSKVLCMGSCFSENIGHKLAYFKFQTLINPFGVLFHPVAIEKLIARALQERYFNDEDVFFHNEKWQCFEVHSQFSNVSKEELIASLNTQLILIKKWIEEATHFIFTYGTAWVYRHIESSMVVANCHKVPQPQFLKELLSPDDVSEILLGIEALIKTVNPTAVIINTVSPIRHIKDGMTGNARSKAHLLAGILEITSAENNTHYFPSYEIMMDELRDYRFYANDMIHPSDVAIEIIWDKFNSAWIDPKTKSLQEKIDSIQKGLQHKPFNSESDAHQLFIKQLEAKISAINHKVPHIKFQNK